MTDVFLAHPDAPEELRQRFLEACARPTSIHQHLTVLRDTASGQKHVTELGTGEGWSTLALLLVQPNTLVSYDLGFQPIVPTLERIKGRTDLYFYVGHSHLVEIDYTDLLFIDTIHTYSHLKEELRLHAGKVLRFLVLHDTTTFGEVGEDRQAPGLWQAVLELMRDDPSWSVVCRHTHNNGLAVLKRGP